MTRQHSDIAADGDALRLDRKSRDRALTPLGEHVMLDAERCILCSRCVRFCDEITGTGELGIFHRGDHSEVGLFPGRPLDNKYTGNLNDICPVGALTDRDFRFRVRVWYLDSAKSVCPGCARGCNIDVHVNRRRPHHNEGRRVARLKPRFNAEVNRWWMCDAGRYGFDFVDDASRLATPLRRDRGGQAPAGWDEAVAAVAGILADTDPDRIGVIASPWMANEDLFALRRLLTRRGIRRVGFAVPPAMDGDEDALLIRADKNPNTRGAELMGLDGDVGAIVKAARDGRLHTLWVFAHDLFASAWPEADVRAALTTVRTLLWSGTNANATFDKVATSLPAGSS